MERRWGFLLLLVIVTSGCIESGSLDLASTDTTFDLSSIASQFKEMDKRPSAGDMGVPLDSLPRYFLRNSEQGSYSEAFSLKGLPSTTIIWSVYKDPYGKEYADLKAIATDNIVLSIGSENVTAVETKRDDLYRITAHIGLYTFVCETQNPEEIDKAGIYGGHDKIVKEIFEAGLKNAFSFDLESLS
jgi:hypothetical protein